MSRIPSFKPREIIKRFEIVGYVIGSHVILYNSTHGKRLTIPLHTKDIPKGTLFSIIKQSGLTKEEFLKLK